MSAAASPAPTVEAGKPRQVFGHEAARQALAQALADDPTVIIFGEDVADPQGGGVMGATRGLSDQYGDRVRSTPISEQAIIGAAVGAAIAGMRPVAEIMLMDFLPVCMDQVVNHAAKIRFMSGGQTSCPITIRCMAGAGAGLGGQHSDMYEAWFAHVPGIKVVMPSNPADWTGLLYSAVMDDDPVLVIEPMLLMHAKGDAAPDGHRVPIGQAAVRREGGDVTVIGYGRAFLDVLTVADRLEGEGIAVEAIDLRTIKPWDRETVLGSVRKTGRAVMVHEAVRDFGVGAELAATLHEQLWGALKAPVRRVASKNSIVPFTPPLETAYLWSAADIESAIRSTLS